MSEPARAAKPVNDALADGKRKAAAGRARPPVGSAALFALQRSAGNSAVNALLAARWRSTGAEARTDIDAALREVRRDEPAIDTVEKGLKRAKAAGVPVELEGPKPPASALAVTKTGFGPAAVAPKKPVPPTKPVPKVSPLGKAAAKRAKAGGGGGPRGAAPPAAPTGGGATAIPAAPLSADQLLQPPVPPKSIAPEQDPAFKQVTGNVKAFAKDKRAHPPAASKAKEAQDAALAPSDDMTGQAKEAKVASMDAQQAGSFDQKAFIAAVKAAIEAKSPKTLTEADDYAKSGKAGEVKGEVKGLVTQGKEGQAKDIETATAAPPDTSKSLPKPVTPMGPEQQSGAPPIPAAGAVPKPAPPEQLNLEAGKQQANQEMADADVSEKQLAESNEPDFQQALADKKEAAAHADTAPGEFRKQEQDVITQGKTEAAAETKAGVAGMQGAKGAALAKLVADKGKTKSKDEAKRAEVTANVQSIYAKTEKDVGEILKAIDPKVEKEFETGEKNARADFESYVSAKMSAYKKDRYSGWLGGYRWLRDKLAGMPSKVNEFYEAGRELYLKQMDGVITRVARIVGDDLTAAKQRIAAGKTEIASYVNSLPAGLKKVGAEASKEIADKFEQLQDDVNAKQDSVVDTLASKYVEARKGLDERIEELQAENKGLVDKAIGAIKAIINTIRKLASMLMDVLSRVAGVVGDIIKAPVRFLGNLIDGVKGGILKFKDNILDHLRKGLMTWLFGELAEGGVELPDKFDLEGIIKLLASLFGLTWRNIRNRIVKQIGEKAMDAIEKGVEIFRILSTAGVAGLWQMLLEKLGDIKEMILEQAKEFVVTRIITAGITWLIGLLNPAAAFIKACKLIYDVVMFFVNNIERIATFVNTVLDSVADIVRGNVGAVVAKVEDALSQMVPILIGFLASVIGLGGIGQKIREIIGKLQKPVMKAIDFVIKTGLKLAGPIIRGLKGIGGKVKAKVAAGKAWVKGKVLGGDDSPAGKQQRLDKGMRAGVSAANRFAGKRVGDKVLKPVLGAVRARYGLGVLEPVQQGTRWAVHGEVQRATLLTQVEAFDLAMLPAGLTADELAYFESRVPSLPLTSENAKYGRPRAQATTHVGNIRANVKNLKGNVESLKEIFRLFGRPTTVPTPEEMGRQQLSARIRVIDDTSWRPVGTGEFAPRRLGYQVLNWDPDLKVPVGKGRRGGKQPRGVVYTGTDVANTTGGPPQTELIARTWAAGGNERWQANTSHTENQLLFWLNKEGPALLTRIVAIELHSTHSPCSTCADQLSGLRKLLDDNRSRDGQPPIPPAVLSLAWDNWYAPNTTKFHQVNRDVTRTTIGDVVKLEKADWRTAGPRG